jgi:hypothetical protein
MTIVYVALFIGGIAVAWALANHLTIATLKADSFDIEDRLSKAEGKITNRLKKL